MKCSSEVLVPSRKKQWYSFLFCLSYFMIYLAGLPSWSLPKTTLVWSKTKPFRNKTGFNLCHSAYFPILLNYRFLTSMTQNWFRLYGNQRYANNKCHELIFIEEALKCRFCGQTCCTLQVYFPNAKQAEFQYVTVPNLLLSIKPYGEILYMLR